MRRRRQPPVALRSRLLKMPALTCVCVSTSRYDDDYGYVDDYDDLHRRHHDDRHHCVYDNHDNDTRSSDDNERRRDGIRDDDDDDDDRVSLQRPVASLAARKVETFDRVVGSAMLSFVVAVLV